MYLAGEDGEMSDSFSPILPIVPLVRSRDSPDTTPPRAASQSIALHKLYKDTAHNVQNNQNTLCNVHNVQTNDNAKTLTKTLNLLSSIYCPAHTQ